MNPTILWLAVAAAGATFAVHAFVGGPVVARPLLADRGLPPASKWLNYYCWHVTTVTLLFLTGALAGAALDARFEPLAVFAMALTLALAVLSAAVALKAGIHPLRFPSTSLFALTGVLIAASLFAGT